MRQTRLYTFKNKKNIGKVNLKDYTADIDNAVASVIPDDYDPYVDVSEDDFIINTTKPITAKQSQNIGRIIAKVPAIGELCDSFDYKNNGHSNQIFIGKDIT